MTISISASGIALDGPLVAGEKVSVTVSGISLAAEDKPTLALLARFPDALLASVELAESETAGTWTGELDTATKQTALFFATARADERRDAALELVAGRASLARLTVPMANSALCPKPDGSPFASPVYVPVPGPPGQGGDPYDQAPQMDGEASAGSADEYARGDHRHPTDTTRQAVVEDLAAIRSGAAAGATAVQPSALSAYRTASAQDAIDGAQNTAIAAKYTKPATGIPASDLASGVLPTALPNPQPLHVGATDYDGSTEAWVQNGTTYGTYGIVTLESATNSTHDDGYAATPLAVKTVADSVAGKADSASIAPAFSPSSTYAVGDYVTYEGLLYKCTTAVSTAGAWDAANWEATSVYKNLPYDKEVAYIVVGEGAYIDSQIIPDNTFLWSHTFRVDSEWSSAYWEMGTNSPFCGFIRGSGGKSNLWVYAYGNYSTVATSSFSDFETMRTEAGGKLYVGQNLVATQTLSTQTSSQTYWIGARTGSVPRLRFSATKLWKGGVLVRDFIPVVNDGAGGFYDRVSGSFFGGSGTGTIGFPADTLPLMDGTAAHGTSPEMAPIDHVHPTDTSRAPLASPAFTGTPTAPTATAGTNTTQIATTAFVQTEARYALTAKTPSVSGTSATVACEDRAINDFTVATGITSLAITPPAAVTGRARDFFCRVTLTDSSLPTVTLSGATIDIGATEVAGMTQGVNLLMFTEIASGHWLASRRSAS